VKRRRKTGAACTALVAAAVVSACTASSVLTPRPKVDVGTQTASVYAPQTPVEAVPPPGAPMAASPDAASLEPAVAPSWDLAPAPSSASTPQPEVALAPLPQARPAAEQPEPTPPVQVAALPVPGPQAPAPAPEAKPVTVGYPRLISPLSQAPSMPADEAACRRELDRLGVVWQDLPPINDGGACRIDHPIKVSALSGGIRMSPPATLNCQMALAFARWTRNELAPAARLRYLSGIHTIHQGSSYSCRRIAGTNTPSAHSRGNALDVMSIDLDNGRKIDVRKPGFFAFRQRSLLNTVRADGCSYFTTVLGPGYNADHRNHFHFDLMPRKGGRRACH